MIVLNTIRRWAKEQRTVSQLNALSVHELRDLGIETDVAGYVRIANKAS